MTNDLEHKINDERAMIMTLDSALKENRTPYLKAQLRLASNMLDDAVTAMRHSVDNPMWVDLAFFSFGQASEKRKKVQEVVGKFGGSDHITESDT